MRLTTNKKEYKLINNIIRELDLTLNFKKNKMTYKIYNQQLYKEYENELLLKENNINLSSLISAENDIEILFKKSYKGEIILKSLIDNMIDFEKEVRKYYNNKNKSFGFIWGS